MPIAAISAGLMLANASSTAMASLSEADFCAAITRSMPAIKSMVPAGINLNSADANCAQKRIEIDMTILRGDPKVFTDAFLAIARSGVCNQQDPTMVTFDQRGWRFRYTFKAAGRETITTTLDCQETSNHP